MLKKVVIVFLLMLLGALAPAAAQDWTISRVDESDGLSDNSVNDLLCDSRGLLWIGTNGGLDYYDGTNFVKVPFAGFGNSRRPIVFTLAEDPAGSIWTGTSEGLFRLEKDGSGMQPFLSPELDGASVRQMCCGGNGVLWIAVKDRNLTRIDTGSGKTEQVPHICKAVCRGSDGAVYAVTSNDIVLVSTDGSAGMTPLLQESHSSSVHPDIARIDCAGAYLFLVSVAGSSQVIDVRTKIIRSLPYTSRLREAIRLESGEFILAARDGIHLADSTLSQTGVLRPFNDNSFRCLASDRHRGIWAGTLFEGLARMSQDNLQFRHYSSDFAGGSFKARDFVETSDGRIWAGTDTRGLLCVNSSGERRSYFPGRNVTGLYPEGDKLWVGTIDEELPVALFDTDTGKIKYYPEAGKSAYAYCRDREGRLWIGGKDGFLVGRETPNGRFEKYVFIPTAQVCRILLASDGSVWVASIAGQVFHYTGGTFSTFRVPVSNILTDLAEDCGGRILATSEGGGLWEFRSGEEGFFPCPGAESRLFKVARAPKGNLLWITGAQGFHILNPDDNRPLLAITREELGIDRFNYSSGFIASDGTLYAGTSDGFISFSAQRLTERSTAVTPVITSCRIFASSGDMDGSVHFFPSSINLGRKSRSFQVNVSALDYALFQTERVFWKIEGRGEWTPVEKGSFTIYDIPTGKWKLRLKAMSLSGEESRETKMDLRVQPKLLQSPLAFLVYLLLFILAAVVAAILSNRLAKEKAEREHERSLLESKMAFLTSIAHEIRTPLSLVQIPLEALIRKFSGSADGTVQENLDIMRRNSLKLTVLINELLDFRKLTDSTFQIHPEFLDIRGILKDAHRRFLPTFMQEGKTLSVSIPDTPVYCETDVRSVGRIFDNLLSNALKYARHHSAISLTVSGNDAVIGVESDGAVLPGDVRELIFQPFYRYEGNASAGVEGTGLGLSTSRQFASLLGGSLSMDDDLKVNRFIFTIPVAASKEPAAGLPVVESKDKSVMVVEDDKDMCRVIGDILSENYNIIYASNGKQALDKIKEGASPTLVVSDVIMPEMDGIALTKALKGNLATSHIPVILLSAEVPDVYMEEGLEGGADAYLEKPFSPKKLRSLVDNLIENRRRIYEFYVSSLPTGGELPTGRVSAMEQKFLRSIQEYVSANLHRNITLDDMAEVVCLSPSTLYKKMKEYADISPMEYVMKVRLHRAVELLKDDSVSVQEVVQAVGFNTHSFFSECFKREFGMTPRAWRTRNVAKTKK